MPMRYVDFKHENGLVHFAMEIILKTGEAVIKVCQMPETVFSLRAGEYGLDPVADAETVWDIVMHEHHLDYDEQYPLLVTEPTLEAARDKHLARCRAEKDKLNGRERASRWTAAERKRHDDVLAAIRAACPADQQLALLQRDHMKHAVRAEWEKVPDVRTPAQVHKARLIDTLRAREGVDETRAPIPPAPKIED